MYDGFVARIARSSLTMSRDVFAAVTFVGVIFVSLSPMYGGGVPVDECRSMLPAPGA